MPKTRINIDVFHFSLFSKQCINDIIIIYIIHRKEDYRMASYVYLKNPNGTTYVYENVSYWDKTEQKTKHHRKCVGKLHPETNEIIPNGKKSAATSKTVPQTESCVVSTIGPALLLDKAALETGVGKILRSSFPEDWERILTCAYYLASEGNALCHAEQWSARNRHPYQFKLTDQRISELLNRITSSSQQDFFRKWVAANHDKGYFALDITSVSSYSEFIDYIRWGYNRDGEGLPHVNLLMVTSEDSHLPVYYRILSGSIKDVSTIDESLAHLKLLGSRPVHLVMDKGFFSEANINALYGSHYRFSVGIPFTSSIAKNAVEENRAGMDSHNNFISIGGDDLYAVTKCTKWNGHRCYIHTYYDSLRAESDHKKFTHKLLECYDELISCNERSENEAFYNKYFIVKDLPKRGRKVQYNEDAISKHKQNSIGWFVMISNKTKDAAEALRSYRQKDAVEKGFDDLKNDLDMKRLRIHSNAAMEGRIFIQFIALILTTYLKNIMEEQGWTRNHNLQEIFSEMKSLKQVSAEGRRKKLVTTLTKRQREIIELYQVTV